MEINIKKIVIDFCLVMLKSLNIYIKSMISMQYRILKKEVKLLVFLNSENNNTCLAPILAQYNIKPVEFLDRLKRVFSFNDEKIDNSLVVSIILSIGKNNIYDIISRKFNLGYLYNIFLHGKKRRYLNVLFLFKVKVLCDYKWSLFFSLICRLLKI